MFWVVKTSGNKLYKMHAITYNFISIYMEHTGEHSVTTTFASVFRFGLTERTFAVRARLQTHFLCIWNPGNVSVVANVVLPSGIS